MTPSGNYKLFVREGIRTEAIRVDVATNIWSDYVFEKDYKLRSLSEVESFIKNKKHLPGIPSAAEVVNTGIDLAEMDAKLLSKIEELTLYLINQQKEIEKLKIQLENIEK